MDRRLWSPEVATLIHRSHAFAREQHLKETEPYHVLCVLTEDETVQKVLLFLGTNAERVRDAMIFIHSDQRPVTCLPHRNGVAERLTVVFGLAEQYAGQRLLDPVVRPHDLLLAITAEGRNVPAGVLESYGVSYRRLSLALQALAA